MVKNHIRFTFTDDCDEDDDAEHPIHRGKYLRVHLSMFAYMLHIFVYAKFN